MEGPCPAFSAPSGGAARLLSAVSAGSRNSAARASDGDDRARDEGEDDEPGADGEQHETAEPFHRRAGRPHRPEGRRADGADDERRHDQQRHEDGSGETERDDGRRCTDGEGLRCQTDEQGPRSPEPCEQVAEAVQDVTAGAGGCFRRIETLTGPTGDGVHPGHPNVDDP